MKDYRRRDKINWKGFSTIYKFSIYYIEKWRKKESEEMKYGL